MLRHLKIAVLLLLLTLVGAAAVAQSTGLPAPVQELSEEGAFHIPFDSPGSTGEIIVKVVIAGQPYRFLVDTGSSNWMLIKPWAIEPLHLKRTENSQTFQQAFGNDKTVPVYTLSTPRIEIPCTTGNENLSIDCPSTVVVSNFDIGDPTIAGVIGFSTFIKGTLRIDYQKHTLTYFAKPNPPLSMSPPEGVALPIEIKNNVPYIDVTVDKNSVPTRMLLDTGFSNGMLTIGASLAKHLGALYYCPAQFEQIDGQERDLADILLPSVRFGDLEERNVTGTVMNADEAGSVGATLLSRFVVTIDARNHLLYLKRIPDYHKKSRLVGGVGLFISQDKQKHITTISDIDRESEAAKYGIRVDDRIVKIDGISTADLTEGACYSHFTGYIGDSVELTLLAKNKSERTLKIPYFNLYRRVWSGKTRRDLSIGSSQNRLFFDWVELGSPSYRAGLRTGDTIVKIGNWKRNFKSQKERMSFLRQLFSSKTGGIIPVRHQNEKRVHLFLVQPNNIWDFAGFAFVQGNIIPLITDPANQPSPSAIAPPPFVAPKGKYWKYETVDWVLYPIEADVKTATPKREVKK